MDGKRAYGRKILTWVIGIAASLSVLTMTAAMPQAQAVTEVPAVTESAVRRSVPMATVVEAARTSQVKLVYIEGERAVLCQADVDVDAVVERAVAYLSENIHEAVLLQTVLYQTIEPDGTPVLDENQLYAYLTKENPLKVKYTKQIITFEPVHFDTALEEDDTMFTDETAVITAGVDGEARVTSDVTYVCGVVTDTRELSREVTKTPVTRVVRAGTQERPDWWPTGKMIQPVMGRLSSDYGKRGRYEFHTGVDIAAKKGTPVVAADGGTVIFAGWWGNYGNYVQIDHNGVITAYAHNSKLLVKEGDHVVQGQQIAEVGSTGRSTGPHSHFEILIGYEFQNPHDYIDFVFEEE
ncbi:MAG: peptidoglycan DD-metalloendopeptidase family protein [Clostridiaceae bacterium]|nr:peptidoglycan DD-metalloendopeptidase family protein [Clostridiaceae bacterium]